MRSNFKTVIGFVERILEKLNVEENKDQVSVVQYSNEPTAEFFLNTHKTKQSVTDNVQALRHKGGRPLNTGAALSYVKDEIFASSSGSRRQQGVPQILILLTGGPSRDEIRDAVVNLKDVGVNTFVVGIKNADILEMQSVSQEPTKAFLVADSSSLTDIEQKLILAIGKSESPVNTSGSRGKNCFNANAQFDTLPASQMNIIDVVFLLDGSDDSQQRFPDITDFVERIVRDLDIDVNGDHVAVAQYSNSAEINFNLNRYVTEKDVLEAVQSLSHKGGYPNNIGAALKYVREHAFSPESGSRLKEGVPQILILLSGDRSRDDIRTPVKMIKETGIMVISIGTTDADTLELQTISKEPKFGKFFKVKETFLFQQKTLQAVTCYSKKKDVVFLIDGSFDSRSGFEEIRNFVKGIVEILKVGNNGDKVAVVQYSRVATVNFYLNSYSSRSDVLNSIRTIYHKFGRPLNTGKALEFVRDHVFAASVGGRPTESVLQYLFIFSGGRSGDDVRGPAHSLKKNGIVTFCFGTKNADTLEMQTISFTPAHYFFVPDYKSLQNIKESVKDRMEQSEEIAQIENVGKQ
uniref:VWFA domain-containing protein n=1 Tax=Oryzias latipes TaxID=8090 RepID=A0A3B3IPL2_ORYLA